MAYTRFGKDSDVYVFASISGSYECCACGLQKHRYIGFATKKTSVMISHLAEHVLAGQKVPQYCIDRLSEEDDFS